MEKAQAQKIGNTIAEALASTKEEPKTPARASKKEEILKNEQARADFIAKDQPKREPVTRDIDIAFPLTSPAEKARANRVADDAEGRFAHPHPDGSNLATPASTAIDPAPQSEAEFKKTGGEGYLEAGKAKPDTSKGTPAETDNVTDKEAKERDEKLEAARKEATKDSKK